MFMLRNIFQSEFCHVHFRNWWSKNWTVMDNDAQMYGNSLTGEKNFKILEMNSGSKVMKNTGFIKAVRITLYSSFQN
jgi:hypothetical protein